MRKTLLVAERIMVDAASLMGIIMFAVWLSTVVA